MLTLAPGAGGGGGRPWLGQRWRAWLRGGVRRTQGARGEPGSGGGAGAGADGQVVGAAGHQVGCRLGDGAPFGRRYTGAVAGGGGDGAVGPGDGGGWRRWRGGWWGKGAEIGRAHV